jgi:aminoglycoside 3-N-acetyltransferase I
MAETFQVNILAPTDLASMRELNEVFARAFEDIENYSAARPDDAYLARLLAQPHVIVVVATERGGVIGGLTAYQLDKLEQDRREIYIYDLAVDEPHRRRGVASALIGALQKEATRRDAYVIFVQADLEDAPAIALYEKLGRKETAHHFDIDPA